MNSLAYKYEEEPWEEMLNGKIVAISPRPVVNHTRVSGSIYRIFGNYLKGKSCEAFPDGVDVYLTAVDRVIPDVMIVCDKSSIKYNGIHGVPDLIVEVLSPSTAQKDKGYKMRLYEKCGVKEYWIVDPRGKSIEVYVLEDGLYNISGTYIYFSADELDEMTEEDKKDIFLTFQTSLFGEDLIISVEDIFEDII